MTERAAPGAQGSTVRNLEFGEQSNSLHDGFIVPADEPTYSAQRWDALDETAFDAFDASYATDSLDVTIGPGEAFVDGWLATDQSYTISLTDFNDPGQTVILAWDADAVYSDSVHDSREEADNVIVTLEDDLTTNVPYIPLWEFETDGNGVIGAIDRRRIGRPGSESNPRESFYTGDASITDDLTVASQPVEKVGKHIRTDDLTGDGSGTTLTFTLPVFDYYQINVGAESRYGTEIRMEVGGVPDGEYAQVDREGATLSRTSSNNYWTLINGQSFDRHIGSWTFATDYNNRPTITGGASTGRLANRPMLLEGGAEGATSPREITLSVPDDRYNRLDVEWYGVEFR